MGEDEIAEVCSGIGSRREIRTGGMRGLRSEHGYEEDFFVFQKSFHACMAHFGAHACCDALEVFRARHDEGLT